MSGFFSVMCFTLSSSLIRAARPIKLEDLVRYITEKNPLVAELRKALDLEVE